jgi:BirA family biotin operon repressor/biotin-[acetyl-CoA-carboxylase] ligase
MHACQLLTCGENYDKNCTVNPEWIHLETVSSTNRWLTERARKQRPGQEIVLVADYQTNGRGQGGNTWVSERGENLLMSLLMYPAFLSASDQFNLSVITSLAICDLIREAVGSPLIKWPNDILAGTGKIAGILIENGVQGNRLSHTVIGIGLNVNQERFPQFPWRATSMALESGKGDEPSRLAKRLAGHLMEHYESLRGGREAQLRGAYLEHLYLLDESATYRSGEKVFDGIIRGINRYGELMLEADGSVQPYGMDVIRLVPG